MGKSGGENNWYIRLEVPGQPEVTLVNVARNNEEGRFDICQSGKPGPYEDHVIRTTDKETEFLCWDRAQEFLSKLGTWKPSMSPQEVQQLLEQAGGRAFWEGQHAILKNGENAPESDLLWSLSELYNVKIAGKMNPNYQKKILKEAQGLLSHPSAKVRLQAALLIGRDLQDARIAEILADAIQNNPGDLPLVVKAAPILYPYYREDDPDYVVNLALAFRPNALCQRDENIPWQGFTCDSVDGEDVTRYTYDRHNSPLSGEEVLAWLDLVNDLIDDGHADSRFLPLLQEAVDYDWYCRNGSSYIWLEREATQAMLLIDRQEAIAFAERKIKAAPNGVFISGIVEALSKTHISFGNSGRAWEEEDVRLVKLLAWAYDNATCGRYGCSSARKAIALYPHPSIEGTLKTTYDNWVKRGIDQNDPDLMDLRRALTKIARMKG